MAYPQNEALEKAKSLLRQLFQFDTQDLDFGIYRVMNLKRKEIEKFIDEDLVVAAEAEFREYARSGISGLEKEVEKLKEEIMRDFGQGTIDNQGEVQKNGEAPKVMKYIKKKEELKASGITQEQVNEVFNHIFEFFSRYYDKGDFLSKRRFGGKEKYYVPYNGEEVFLYWANRDQYYIKSGAYFKNYSFKAGAWRICFVLKQAETEQNNVSTETKFFVLDESKITQIDEERKELEIYFNWRSLTEEEKKKQGKRNTQETITSSIITKLYLEIGDKGPGIELRKKVNDERTLLAKHINRYVKTNTTDYFIHKNLAKFLEQELDFYLKNEVLDLDEIERMDERNIQINKTKIHAIRNIATKIIEFLAEIENFQKMLFEKKKFVLKADYCMTLNLVQDGFYAEIGKNEAQVAEWRKLFKLDETTKNTLYHTQGKREVDSDFLKSHGYLVLDTKFFDQGFKDQLIGSIENLDEKIEGTLIQSENFQALNLLLAKYKNRVKFIYIDPPYNTGKDDFIYKDNYQHSSWLQMMSDRLKLAYDLLEDKGVLFVSIDDNEFHRLRTLSDSIFGPENRIAELVWDLGTGTTAGHFARSHEYILAYGRNKEKLPNFKYVGEEDLIVERATKRPSNKNPLSDITFPEGVAIDSKDRIEFSRVMGTVTEPIHILNGLNGEKKVVFKGGKLTHQATLRSGWAVREQILDWISGKTTYDSKGQLVRRFFFEKNGRLNYEKVRGTVNPRTVISGLTNTKRGSELVKDILGEEFPGFPKPVDLLEFLIKLAAAEGGIVLDFFSGSGTTAHATLNANLEDNLKRKYILVEMGDYFDTKLKPRIQRVMYSRNWKDGMPISNEGISHMFEYMYLEQYEDSLNNIKFREFDKTIQETLEGFGDYFLRYMLEYETRESPARLAVGKFKTPFDYKLKIISGNEYKEQTVDLVETFNYLLGLKVEKLRAFKDGDRLYRTAFGKRAEEKVVVIWRNTEDLDLERDKLFIERSILAGNAVNRILINGDSYVKNSQAIEPEFRRLMGA